MAVRPWCDLEYHLGGSEFRLPVAGHAALDAFHHPYAFGRPYEEHNNGVPQKAWAD